MYFCSGVDKWYRRNGETGEVVVFGQPEAREAGSLGVLCQVERVGQRVRRGEAFADIGKIENGEVYHAAILAPLCHAAIRGGPDF